jgi:hypothetical protein
MITDTSLYKFAKGPMKGHLLDEVGLAWELATRDGRPVALFSDGRTAEYYIETFGDRGYVGFTPPPGLNPDFMEPFVPAPGLGPDFIDQSAKIEVDPPIKAKRRRRSAAHDPISLDGIVVPLGSRGSSTPIYTPPRILKEKSYMPHRPFIAKYKMGDGRDPQGLCNPVYAVHTDEPICNYDRQVVGTGLREYLWLHETLREMGRGRWAAMIEAWQIYFL